MFEYRNMTFMHGTGMMFFLGMIILAFFRLFFNNKITDKSSIILKERFAKGERTE